MYIDIQKRRFTYRTCERFIVQLSRVLQNQDITISTIVFGAGMFNDYLYGNE